MSKIDKFLVRAVLAFFVLAFAGLAAHSQTTIFNIPTADTLQRRVWNFEADLVVKPVSYDKGGYQTYGYRLAYGLSNKTELGANFYLSYNGSSVAQSEFSVKRRVYQNERRRVSVAGGGVVTVPLRNRVGDRTAAIIYGNARKTISPFHGMTLTGGAYTVIRGNRNFGTRTGAMIGLVQPINRKFSFVSDWFSGQNRLGYVSAGVNWNITSRQYLLMGYSVGNSGRGNNALAAYYGLTF